MNAGKCPMKVKVFEDSRYPITYFAFCGSHTHGQTDSRRFWQCTQMADPIRKKIIELGKAGESAATIFVDISLSVMKQFEALLLKGIPLPPSWVITEEQVRNTLFRESITPRFTRLDVSDFDDVSKLSQRDPRVRIKNPGKWNTVQDEYDEHVQIYIGDRETQAYKLYCERKLAIMDATHAMTKYGYYIYTLMGIGDDGHVHIVGHLLTSDRSHSSLETWLRFVSGDNDAPAEFLIDKDNVERNAIENVFGFDQPIFTCWFHALKSIRKETSGLNQKTKSLITALMTMVHYSKSQEALDENITKARKAFSVLPKSTSDYLDQNWLRTPRTWVLLHRKYPSIRTTNHVESYHRMLKFSNSGAKGEAVRRVGDAIRILLSTDADRWARAIAKLLRGGKPSTVAKRLFEQQGAKARQMLDQTGPAKQYQIMFADAIFGQGCLYNAVNEEMYSFDLVEKCCTCGWSQRSNLQRCCKHLVLAAIVLDGPENRRLVSSGIDDPSVDLDPPHEDLYAEEGWVSWLRRDSDDLIEKISLLALGLVNASETLHRKIDFDAETVRTVTVLMKERASVLGIDVGQESISDDSNICSHDIGSRTEGSLMATGAGCGGITESPPVGHTLVTDPVCANQDTDARVDLPEEMEMSAYLAVLDAIPRHIIQQYLDRSHVDDATVPGDSSKPISDSISQAKYYRNISTCYGPVRSGSRKRGALPSVGFHSTVKKRKTAADRSVDQAARLEVVTHGTAEECAESMSQSLVRCGKLSGNEMSAAQSRKNDQQALAHELRNGSNCTPLTSSVPQQQVQPFQTRESLLRIRQIYTVNSLS
jgi:hypothetical protein